MTEIVMISIIVLLGVIILLLGLYVATSEYSIKQLACNHHWSRYRDFHREKPAEGAVCLKCGRDYE